MKSLARIPVNQEATEKFGQTLKMCTEQREIMTRAIKLIGDVKAEYSATN